MSKIISKRKRDQLNREMADARQEQEAEDLEWILEKTSRDVVVDINYIDFGDDYEDHQQTG